MKSIYCLALTLALPLDAPAAQETPTLASGTRVRVTTLDSRVVGTLESIDGVTIVVRRQSGAVVNLPRARGTKVDVSAGPGTCSPDRRDTCVLLGFLGGAALGVGVGVIAESSCDFCGGEVIAIALAAGGLVGTIVGAVVGGEPWRRTELPARVTVAPGVPGALKPWRAVRVGVSLTF